MSVSKYDDERLKFIDASFEERQTIASIKSPTLIDSHDTENDKGLDETHPLASPPIQFAAQSLDPISAQVSGEVIQTKSNTHHDDEAIGGATPRCQNEYLSKKRNVPPPNNVQPCKRKKKDTLIEEFRKNREERNSILREISQKKITPVHTFFSSMADIVCQFPPEKVGQIRSQVCNMVTEMELSVLEQQKSHSYNMSHEIQSPLSSTYSSSQDSSLHSYSSAPIPSTSFDTQNDSYTIAQAFEELSRSTYE